MSEMLCAASIVFVGAGFVQAYLRYPIYFIFQPNAYALLSVLEVLVNCALLYALYRRKGNFHGRTWFAICISGFILLGLGEMFERLSTTPEQALFWSELVIFGLISIPVGFYMFAHYYTGERNRHNDALLPALVIGSTAILTALLHDTSGVQLILKTKGSWGYGQPISIAFVILMLWIGVVIGLAIAKFVRFQNSVTDSTQKRQSRIIIIGASSALTGALFFDVIPRYLGLQILPVGVLFQSILPLGVMYAIYRYDTFSIDFSAVSNEIFDALGEAVFITDASYLIQMANTQATLMTSYGESMLKNQSVMSLFDPGVFETIRTAIVTELPAGKLAKIDDIHVIGKSGIQTAVNVTVSRLEGSTPAYLFAIIDITEQKQYYAAEQSRNKELEAVNKNFRDQQQAMLNLLEDSRDLSELLQQEKAGVEQKVTERTAEVRAERARLEASINSLDIGFVIVDKDKQILTANGAFRTIIDSVDKDIKVGIDQLAVLLGGSFDILKAIDGCLSNGQNLTKDALQIGERMVRIFIAPIFEDSTEAHSLGAVVLAEDITEAKALERSRDEFFSIASHELRTPLTAIRGNTSMMMDFYKDELSDPSLKEMVDDIHDSSIRLITIVNDFLDTSRLEQGKISFNVTDFDIKDLAEEVAQEFTAGEVNAALYIKVTAAKQPLPWVRADRDRLKQTIINLVGNGFKFTEKGGVHIELVSVDQRMHINVTDTGKGIPVESRNLLFRKFQQASNNILTRDSTRSTGLGLYISKLIMEGMGGKIYMQSSEVGKGSTFVIEVPLATSEATEQTA